MISSRERGQILILLAAWLFFGGGASTALVVYDRPISEVKKVVKRSVADADRRDAILSDVSQWEARQKQRDKDVNGRREALLEMLRHKDAARSELEPVIAHLDETFLDMNRSFLNLRFRVKEQVTRAEWADIVARPDR